MDLLLVEDDPGVLRFLHQTLEPEGHRIHACTDCEELGDFLDSGTASPEVIVLDRMLRGRDGLRMVPAIKKKLASARILVLSAINTPDEKAAALDAGVDDYLSKPFSSVELSARIRALARRTDPANASTLIKRGDVTLDLLGRAVFAKNRKIDLSNKEFQVLLALAKTPGRVFNKYQLLNKVWDIQTDIESNVVEVTIRNIRGKLLEAGSDLRIENKRNVGYWIEN